MKKNRTIQRGVLRIGVLLLLILSMTIVAGCGGSAVYAPDSAGRVLSAVLTYPGDLAEVRGTPEEEEAWREAIGEYMTEDAFAVFYESEERTCFADRAEETGSALTLQDVKVEKDEGNRQILLTAVDVIGADSSVKTSVLRWEIEYNIEDTDMIEGLRCVDTGDLMSE